MHSAGRVPADLRTASAPCQALLSCTCCVVHCCVAQAPSHGHFHSVPPRRHALGCAVHTTGGTPQRHLAPAQRRCAGQHMGPGTLRAEAGAASCGRSVLPACTALLWCTCPASRSLPFHAVPPRAGAGVHLAAPSTQREVDGAQVPAAARKRKTSAAELPAAAAAGSGGGRRRAGDSPVAYGPYGPYTLPPEELVVAHDAVPDSWRWLQLENDLDMLGAL